MESRDLYCPYCGNGLEVTERQYLNGDDYTTIDCESSKCGAQWGTYGTLNRLSKMAVDNNQKEE